MKLLIPLLLLGVTAQAADFNNSVDEIVLNNPSLKSERAAAMAETMNRIADNRLEATEIGFSHVWGSPREAGNKLSVEVSQAFDWPGVYGARRRASSMQQTATAKHLAASERSLRLEAHTTLLEVVDANLRCELLERIVANLDSMHSAAHTMLDGGQITELDHRKVALEEVAMKQQLADARSALTSVLAAVTTLNGGRLPEGVIDLREYPHALLRPLGEYLAAPSPELEAAKADADALRLEARAERLGLLPGFSVGYIYEREAGVNFNGFSLGLRLPQYSAKPKMQAALFQAEAAEALAFQEEESRRIDISANYATAQRQAALLAEYEHAFGSANYEEMLRKSLIAGQISYTDYFSDLNFYLGARLEYLSRLLSYHTLLAQLTTLL